MATKMIRAADYAATAKVGQTVKFATDGLNTGNAVLVAVIPHPIAPRFDVRYNDKVIRCYWNPLQEFMVDVREL